VTLAIDPGTLVGFCLVMVVVLTRAEVSETIFSPAIPRWIRWFAAGMSFRCSAAAAQVKESTTSPLVLIGALFIGSARGAFQ
jgi:hypothetical protein